MEFKRGASWEPGDISMHTRRIPASFFMPHLAREMQYCNWLLHSSSTKAVMTVKRASANNIHLARSYDLLLNDLIDCLLFVFAYDTGTTGFLRSVLAPVQFAI